MKPCDHLSQYLDGRLERAGREYFESHLNHCADCRKLEHVWLCTKNALKNEARDRQRRLVPTDTEASRLVQRAQLEASSRGFFSVRVLVPLTACISFAAAFFVAFQLSESGLLPTAKSATVAAAEAPGRADEAINTPLIGNAASAKPALEYETKQDGRTTGRLGNDRFGLAPESRLRVVTTEGKTTILRLDRGIAAFNVAKRKNGRKFIVEAGDYRVEVVGTRFTVDHRGEGVRVAVTEGIVKVYDGAGRNWRVVAGEAVAVSRDGGEQRIVAGEMEQEETALLLGETAVDPLRVAALTAVSLGGEALAALFEGDTESSTSQSPARSRRRIRRNRPAPSELETLSLAMLDDGPTGAATVSLSELLSNESGEAVDEPSGPEGLELWRQWVLEGRFEAAEAALLDHLTLHPIDTDAYSLLADCRRKAGKYAEAVDTYKKLTAIAGEYQANRARFKAGVLMQENLKNHLGAAAIFDDYLSTGKGTPLLRAKATVRLAESLIELGETERAEKLLRRIVSDYSGSSVAIQAREMLQRVD